MIRTPLALLMPALLVLALPAAAQAPGLGARDLIIRNRGEAVLRELYAIEPNRPGLGPDRLGAEVIPAGRDHRLRLGNGPCRIELRAVFEDGGSETRAVNACTAREVIFDDSDTRAVEVVNDTDQDLRELYLSRPGVVGPDRLGANIVPAHDTLRIRLRGERECRFEARAVFQGARQEASQRVDICAAPRIAFGDPSIPLREVTIANQGRRVLRELYATTGEDWGADRFGVNVLRPGQSFLLRVRTRECQLRLRGVFDDNRAQEHATVEVCQPQPQPVAFGAARRMTITHAHGRPLRAIYLSAVEEDDWGANLIEGTPLTAGQSRELGLEGGCRADIRVVFDNGNAEELRAVDVCAQPVLTVRPGWTVD